MFHAICYIFDKGGSVWVKAENPNHGIAFDHMKLYRVNHMYEIRFLKQR